MSDISTEFRAFVSDEIRHKVHIEEIRNLYGIPNTLTVLIITLFRLGDSRRDPRNMTWEHP